MIDDEQQEQEEDVILSTVFDWRAALSSSRSKSLHITSLFLLLRNLRRNCECAFCCFDFRKVPF